MNKRRSERLAALRSGAPVAQRWVREVDGTRDIPAAEIERRYTAAIQQIRRRA
jgi:hypothetical protein